jgi:hypothetical protein
MRCAVCGTGMYCMPSRCHIQCHARSALSGGCPLHRCEGYTEGTWGDCAMTGNTTMPPFITLDQGAQWFGNCQVAISPY